MNLNEIDFNDEFSAAFDALENTRDHIFITGKAGTGKSTLLQYFRQKTKKNIAVLAPTGVSAIHIKGQTIHSFFQFRPDITPQTVGDIIIRKPKRQLYRKLDAVLIDEISMVRADLLDCIDAMLRLHGPHHDRPFGGVQMIFWGDLFQLPPVVGRDEGDLFKTLYPTPFFFSAKAFEGMKLKIMELSKIYRQKDEQFIHLLNAVRENALMPHHLGALNTRVNPKHQTPKGEFYITLTTTNALADKVNMAKLNELPGRSHTYHSITAGEFDRKAMPGTDILELKAGAQVMMLNNDAEKRWVNGSLGVIAAIRAGDDGEDLLIVDLDNGTRVDVQKHSWELYQYYFDEALESLSSKIIGHCTQYPLKLAWAVTIHKSQGQTFDKVIIDIGYGTFSHGQIYVALSRCTSLDGVVLKQPLANRHILLDNRVLDFHRHKVQVKPAAVAALVLAFLLAACPVFADDRSQEVDKALSVVQEQKAESVTWEGRNSGQPYLSLLNEYETKINPDRSWEETYHTRVKVQHESGKQLGEWPVYYNKSRETIVDVQAFVETPEGKKVQAKEMKDVPGYQGLELYEDLMVKVVTMPQVDIGSVLDVTVKTKGKDKGMPKQFWDEVPYPVIPTKFARHTYVFPENMPLNVKVYGIETKPNVEKKDGMVRCSFTFSETYPLPEEEMMPPSDQISGSIFFSSVPDWKDVANWYRETAQRNIIENPSITMQAMQAVNGKVTDKDKVRAIMEDIQDNFKYVPMNFADHMLDMHPTHLTFKAKYGDSKDIALLAKQMLKTVGIDSDLVLMSGEYTGNPDNALPSPAAFEHVILEVAIDGKKYFVDPQTKGFDLGQYPTNYDNAYVMVIDDKGFRFDHLPVGPAEEHSLITTSDIQIAPDGSGLFDTTVQLPLEASQSFRAEWEAAGPEHRDKFFEGLEANFAQGGNILSHEVTGLKERYGPITFRLKYQAPNAYPVANDMILLKESDQGDIPEFADPRRAFAVFIPTNSVIRNTNTYHVPEGYAINFVPPDFQVGIDFAEVNSHYAKAKDTVTVDTVYLIKRASVPPQRYPEVRKFRAALSEYTDKYIILKKTSRASTEAKDWIKQQ